jgi:hypothetical protein
MLSTDKAFFEFSFCKTKPLIIPLLGEKQNSTSQSQLLAATADNTGCSMTASGPQPNTLPLWFDTSILVSLPQVDRPT